MGLREKVSKFSFCFFWPGRESKPEGEQEVRIEEGRVVGTASTAGAPLGSVSNEGKDLLATSLWTPATNEAFADDEGDVPRPEEMTENEIAKRGRLPSLDRFWTYLEVSGRAVTTIGEYHYDARWWIQQAGARGRTVYTLQAGDMEACLKGLHPATLRRKLACLRTLARFYLREGHARLHTEATKLEAPRLPERLPGDRGRKEFRRLRNLARECCEQGERFGLWIGLMLMSGLRISEVRTAVAASEDGYIRVIGKGNKERMVPAPLWVLTAMETIQRDGKGGWAAKRNTIWKGLRARNLKKPHSFRHTYASELLHRGKSLEQIRVLLGHVKIDTTTIYAQTQVESDAAALLDGEEEEEV